MCAQSKESRLRGAYQRYHATIAAALATIMVAPIPAQPLRDNPAVVLEDAAQGRVEPPEPSPTLWGPMGPFANRDPAREIKALRGPHTKQFRNEDGTVTAVVKLQPVHYQDAGGGLQEIDTALSVLPASAMPYTWAVTRHPLRMYFGRDSRRGTLLLAGNGVEIELCGDSEIQIHDAEGGLVATYSRAESSGSVQGSRVEYANPFAGLRSLERLTVLRRGLKSEVILHSPPATAHAVPRGTLSFVERLRFPKGGAIRPAPSGSAWAYEIVDSSSKLVAVIPVPVVFDSSCALLDAPTTSSPEATLEPVSLACPTRLYQEGSSWYLESHVPLEWLLAPQRVYPVTLDPTIELEPFSWGYANPTTSECYGTSQDYVKVEGGAGCGTWAGWLYFDISNIPMYIDVDNLVLSVYPWSESSSPWNVTVRDMGTVAAGSSCSAKVAQACNGTTFGSFSGSYSPGCYLAPGTCWHNFTLSTAGHVALESYRRINQSFFGLGVRSNGTSPNNKVRLVARSSIELEPELEINYCALPSNAPTLTSPANGVNCVASSGTLSWQPVSGATRYKVQIGTSCQSGPDWEVTTTYYQYSGLLSGRQYHWRVCAGNSCGWGPWSQCFLFTTDPGPLSPPGLQSPTNGATCQATSGTLSWSPVSGAAQYRVQIGTSCGSGAEYDVGGTQYQYSGLQPGGTYYWRVKTKNSCGTWGNYSGCFSFTVDPGPLSPPALQSPTNGATCQATSGTLSWSPVSGAAQYRVQIGTSCGSGAEYDVGGTQYQYSGLQPGTTYHWRVRTRSGCGAWGEYSACYSFDTAPLMPPPDSVRASDGTYRNKVQVTWDAVPGASEYRVYRDGSAIGSWQSSTIYDDGNTTTCTTYRYQVKARNICGESDLSSSDSGYSATDEVCNGIDDDCDGQVDEGDVCDQPRTWYRDADGDGYGNPAVTTQAVQQPPGYVANGNDCDDNCSTCYPGGTEVCDGKDNDCDGQTDEGGVCDQSRTWYRDADGDGYGNPAVTTQAVQQPPGYVANDDDCNDADAQVNPGIADCANSPDRIDNDCNGLVDDDQSCRDDGGGGLCPVVAMVILAVSCVGLARSLGRRQ